VVFDADKAGELASLRSLELFLEEQVNVKIATLKENTDPDSFVRQFGIDRFQQIIKGSKEIFDYKLGILLAKYDINNPWEKSKVAGEMLLTIKKIKNEILKFEYIRRLSEVLNINQESLILELSKIKNFEAPESLSLENKKDIFSSLNNTEYMLLKLVLDDFDNLRKVREFLVPDELQDAVLKEIFRKIFELANQGIQVGPAELISYLDDEISSKVISRISSQQTLSYDENRKEQLLKDCLRRIKMNSILLACQDLQSRISSAQKEGNVQLMNELIAEFNSLIKKRGALYEKANSR